MLTYCIMWEHIWTMCSWMCRSSVTVLL